MLRGLDPAGAMRRLPPPTAAEVVGVDVLGTPVGCTGARRGATHGQFGQVDLAGASWHTQTLSLRHNSHMEFIG